MFSLFFINISISSIGIDISLNNSFLILKNLCKTLGDDIKTHNSMQ